LVILSCCAFIPITGGRGNFIIIGSISAGLYIFKNFEKLKRNKVKNFFKFIGLFAVGVFLGAIFSISRIGADKDVLISSFYRLQFVSNSGLKSVLSLPYGIGLTLASFIFAFYDYTGGNVYYLSIYLDNYEKIPYNTDGVYNFSVLNKFSNINWNKTHDAVDGLYLKYDIKYNVWSTSIRDFSVDFGVIGAFVFVFLLALLFFLFTKIYL